MLLPSNPGASLADELDALDCLSDETWVNAALITSSSGVVPLLENLKSPLVDENARRIARERATVRGQRQLEFVDFVLANPAAVLPWVRQLLEDCEASFSPMPGNKWWAACIKTLGISMIFWSTTDYLVRSELFRTL